MKKLFTLYLFSLTLVVQAQDNTFSSNVDSDPEATKILNVLQERFNQAGSAIYDFSLDMEFPGQAIETQNGTLRQKGDRFVFSMGDQEIYSDTETVWMYDKAMNIVQIHDADFGADGSFMSPSEFINIYNSKDYSYAITNEWYEGAELFRQIDFKPLDSDSEYFKIRLELTGKKNDINSIKVFSKDGSRYVLKINDINIEEKLSDDFFVFNVEAYKDIQIENLRID